MSKHRKKMQTTIQQIAKYWAAHSEICESDLNFDWDDCAEHCWNCGDNKKSEVQNLPRLQRAHIIPYCLGGADIASNYVLLCKECHRDAPNTKNPDDMWHWIKSNKTVLKFTDTYKFSKALEMFKKKEGYDFFESVKDNDTWLEEEMKNIGPHETSINIVTFYYMLRNAAIQQGL